MKKHIVCFGDSNTHGYCAETGKRFDEQVRWPKQLERLLGDEYLVLEEGLGGRTTCFPDPLTEGLAGIDYLYPCLMTHKPIHLLIIMLGTNDTKERFGSSAACIGLGLKRLILKAKATVDCWAEGKPNILVVVPKNIEKEYEQTEVLLTMGKGCAEKSQAQAKEYEKICLLTECHYFDANTVVKENNKIDFMHLTAQGHTALAEGLAPVIHRIL